MQKYILNKFFYEVRSVVLYAVANRQAAIPTLGKTYPPRRK